jgi:hypothetical protein
MICKGRVIEQKSGNPIVNATVVLTEPSKNTTKEGVTDSEGYYSIDHVPETGDYTASCTAFGVSQSVALPSRQAGIGECQIPIIEIGLGFQFSFLDENLKPMQVATADRRLTIRLEGIGQATTNIGSLRWATRPEAQSSAKVQNDFELIVPHGTPGLYVEATAAEIPQGTRQPASMKLFAEIPVLAAPLNTIRGDVNVDGRVALREPVGVRLLRTQSDPTLDQALWVAIRNRTRALSFGRYQDFMNRALRWEERTFEVPEGVNAGARERLNRDLSELGTDLHGVRAYQVLKNLTETFLLLECGVRIERSDRIHVPFDFGEEAYRLGEPFTLDQMEERLKAYLGDRGQLPYISRVVRAAFPDVERRSWGERMIAARINEPCLIELIWSYWMEEGMLVQTMNAIAHRFQNVRSGQRDTLQNFEIDPLRPVNNLIWGYVQDEFNRLTVRRRAYEYVHQYGLTLYGRATSGMRPADSRSKFLEAFHNLMYQSSVFFKEDFQTTVIADGFPLLNALKEVHLILAQGAQNQYGDLGWTSRAEMMLMQYMLSRREIRDFLQSRAMVPYKEPWEAQVDTMKSIQGWTDVTVSHFRDLAVYGEQILLSIRFGDWIAVNDEDSAKNWARYFRPEIQGYLHSYRAVTGIDLTNPDTVDSTIPGILLQRRMDVQQRAR